MKHLMTLRAAYHKIRAALPWLDCYVSDLPPPFEDVPAIPPTESVTLDFTSSVPRLLRQTDHSFEEIAQLARKNPQLPYIIVSGTRKLLYHIAPLTELLKTYPNLYLATANFCNEFALERLVAEGVAKKLLYGSMMPYLDAGNTLGMIALGKFDWKTKCDIAGNNFRRLLGIPEVIVPEVPIPEVPPFIVDAHTHTINPETESRFPAPDAEPSWPVWQKKMNSLWVKDFYSAPSETITDVTRNPARVVLEKLCRESYGHARYFEVFDPNLVDGSLRELEKSLADPFCIGIKIHPVEHHVYASDPRYEQAFETAERYHKTIMTHSWGLSDYNPNQRFGTPAQFAPMLEKYPQVTFVFGHTGGRPNGFIETVEMCQRFPQTYCDLAGDFFHNGFLEHAVRKIGTERIIFASDSYWIDVRCMLGMLFETKCSDEVLWDIVHNNAIKAYRPREIISNANTSQK